MCRAVMIEATTVGDGEYVAELDEASGNVLPLLECEECAWPCSLKLQGRVRPGSNDGGYGFKMRTSTA